MNPSYRAGKQDAKCGLKATPQEHEDQYKYMEAYRKYQIDLQEAQKTKPPRDPSPMAQCATCLTPKREKALDIYDVANDVLFCNVACQEARKDRS